MSSAIHHYTARTSTGAVLRRSTNRTYTHCVATLSGLTGTWEGQWCGTRQLAEQKARQAQNRYTDRGQLGLVEICEVTE